MAHMQMQFGKQQKFETVICRLPRTLMDKLRRNAVKTSQPISEIITQIVINGLQNDAYLAQAIDSSLESSEKSNLNR